MECAIAPVSRSVGLSSHGNQLRYPLSSRAINVSMRRTSGSIVRPRPRQSQGGFTVLELVVVIIVISIVAAVSLASWRPANTSINYQADELARNLRHAQTLAMTWRQPLQVSASGGSYSVVYVAGGSVTNPSTGQAFTVNLKDGVVFSQDATVDFDTLGRPKTGVSFNTSQVEFILSTSTGNTAKAILKPLTGFVEVSY